MPDEAEQRPMLRRALVASTVGSAIGAYDFLLYSTAAGLTATGQRRRASVSRRDVGQAAHTWLLEAHRSGA